QYTEAASASPADAIDAMKPAAERSQDFVADGLRRERRVVDAVALIEQLDIAAGNECRRIVVGHVESEKIHGDLSDDGSGLASDAGAAAMRGRPQPPVGVSHGDGGDACRLLDAMRGTVSNALPPVNVAYLQDFCLETHGLTHRIGPARNRIDAVERGADAHHVEEKIATQEEAR